MNAGRWAPEAHLAGVEGLRLLARPVLWVSLLTIVSWAFVVESPTEEHFLLSGFGLVVPAFTTMVLVALATRRSRTQDVDELFDVLPVGPARRSVGHGASALAVGALAMVTTLAVWAYRWPSDVLGVAEETVPAGLAVPRPSVAQLLQGPIALVAVCALGVALTRWVPGGFVVVALSVPAAAQFMWFGLWMAEGLHPNTWWWPFAGGWVHGDWVGPCREDASCALEVSGFDTVTPWWHVAYLCAVTVTLITIAVLRDRRDRTAWMAFAGSLAAAVALAVAQAVVSQDFVSVGAT